MTYALLAYERTLGSKTFQYQEEKRSIDISQVAASENETAQTQSKSYFGTSAYGLSPQYDLDWG